MKHEEVIEKLKKLLSRAESSNDNEANVAMSLAMKLMAQYNLSMKDIETKRSDEDKYYSTLIPVPLGHSAAQFWICHVLKDYFHVYPVVSTIKNKTGDFLRIIGEYHNVETGYYIYQSLERQFSSLWAKYQEDTNCPNSAYESFVTGLYYGLNTVLSSEKFRQSNIRALTVISDELNKYGETKTGDRSGGYQITDDGIKNQNSKVVDDGKKYSSKISLLNAIGNHSVSKKKIA
jgi:hypothetical protein